MSHRYLEGEVYHKRLLPKEHRFTYPFFMVDIDLSSLDTLHNTLFALEGFNLFSFRARDHFGPSQEFLTSVNELIRRFGSRPTGQMRFVTLPRIAGFVFNPISMLLLFEEERPTMMFAEVHNYNGGRIIYPVALHESSKDTYRGSVSKEMYVSPFFGHEGQYDLILRYDTLGASLTIKLEEEGRKMLTSTFTGKALAFRTSTTAGLFARHTLLSVWVVTRTLWQSLRLKMKGMSWHSPRPIDQIRRY